MEHFKIFEEEYAKFNSLVNNVTSSLVHSKDIYSNLVLCQKNLIDKLSDSKLTFDNFESFLSYIKDFILISEDLVSSLKVLYESISTMKESTPDAAVS